MVLDNLLLGNKGYRSQSKILSRLNEKGGEKNSKEINWSWCWADYLFISQTKILRGQKKKRVKNSK